MREPPTHNLHDSVIAIHGAVLFAFDYRGAGGGGLGEESYAPNRLSCVTFGEDHVNDRYRELVFSMNAIKVRSSAWGDEMLNAEDIVIKDSVTNDFAYEDNNHVLMRISEKKSTAKKRQDIAKLSFRENWQNLKNRLMLAWDLET